MIDFIIDKLGRVPSAFLMAFVLTGPLFMSMHALIDGDWLFGLSVSLGVATGTAFMVWIDDNSGGNNNG